METREIKSDGAKKVMDTAMGWSRFCDLLHSVWTLHVATRSSEPAPGHFVESG